MTVDLSWPLNGHVEQGSSFLLQWDINTQKWRIWAKKNPRILTEVLLQSPNVTVWCGFTATFILRLL
ncbi:hypothetical protein TNCT_17611 [Trichonephila clavata]|uniref:Uncharacterized protein n=1 Tax=Trichonephila clavata TaxID=2740835 RepID=A0A8X6HQK2_TRICU|nr:hypothetical protein TNCT_17611 [Trichonephila clavata]